MLDLVLPPNFFEFARSGPINNLRCDFLEESRGQKAIIESPRVAWYGGKIRTGPYEAVHFTDNHPRAFTVETQACFGDGWNFDGVLGTAGRAVRDRCHDHDPIAFLILDRQNDDHGAVFGTFFTTLFMFTAPEIGIRNDHPRLRWGDWHTSSFRIRRSDGRAGREPRPC